MSITRYIFLFLFLSSNLLLSQNQSKEIDFQIDAVSFYSGRDSSNGESIARVDVYSVVPYQLLTFVPGGEYYAAKYNLRIIITDTTGNRVAIINDTKKVAVESYFEAQGGNAGYDFTQKIAFIGKGEYKISVEIEDDFNKAKYSKQRTVSIIDFNTFPFSLSGILLLSSIEEVNGRYKISPHISDNISKLNDGFFAFFEAYFDKSIDTSTILKVDFVYQILNQKNEIISSSAKISKEIQTNRPQQFINIPLENRLPYGIYTLKIIALRPNMKEDFNESDYLAVALRSIKSAVSLDSKIYENLDISISQMMYVANKTEIEYIQNAENDIEKQRRFDAFWAKLDPSPNTDKNEAMEEYYNRIKIANAKFKAYTEGWLTDRGRVFVVLGPPQQIDQTMRQQDGTEFQRWIYANNREIIFHDRSNFGDFRLYRPFNFNEMFRYNN